MSRGGAGQFWIHVAAELEGETGGWEVREEAGVSPQVRRRPELAQCTGDRAEGTVWRESE